MKTFWPTRTSFEVAGWRSNLRGRRLLGDERACLARSQRGFGQRNALDVTRQRHLTLPPPRPPARDRPPPAPGRRGGGAQSSLMSGLLARREMSLTVALAAGASGPRMLLLTPNRLPFVLLHVLLDDAVSRPGAIMSTALYDPWDDADGGGSSDTLAADASSSESIAASDGFSNNSSDGCCDEEVAEVSVAASSETFPEATSSMIDSTDLPSFV